ncbi:hypothetical protein HYX19_01260 [Candidatus Woesearchaeota archaeon]|nr:hypothetical protein [Candidatus Woesearchaeota archaeon]
MDTDVRIALEKIIENYSLLKSHLGELNLESVVEYIKKTNEEKLVYKKDKFEINFLIEEGGIWLDRNEAINFLGIINKWQKDRIKMLIFGGAAFVFLGGKDYAMNYGPSEAKDFDYFLIFDGESKKSLELGGSYETVFNFVYGKPKLSDMFRLNKRKFLHEGEHTEDILRFDFLGFRYMLLSELKQNFTVFFENDYLQIYLPLKDYLSKCFSYIDKNCLFDRWPEEFDIKEFKMVPKVIPLESDIRKRGRRANILMNL